MKFKHNLNQEYLQELSRLYFWYRKYRDMRPKSAMYTAGYMLKHCGPNKFGY